MVDSQFHATVLRQLGVPVLNQETSAGAMEVEYDMFTPRKANVLVVVDGVTSEELALNREQAIVSEPLAIRASFAPAASSAALLATMLTGAAPHEHGIVADQWDYLGETEHAYVHVFPEIAQVADVLAQHSLGRSHIVAASASPVFARALGLRPALDSYGYHAASLQYNVHSSRVIQVAGNDVSPVAELELPQLLEILRAHFRDITLLDTSEHTALYAELAMMLKAVSNLAAKGQSPVAFPDLYNFAISALNPIRSIHGTQASEYTAALALVRKTIVRVIEKVQQAYDNQAIYEVVCFRTSSRSEDQFANVAYTVATALNVAVERITQTFPHIYLPESFDTAAACRALSALNIDAFCPHSVVERVTTQQSNLNDAFAQALKARAVIVDDNADDTVASWLMFMFYWILFIVIVYFIWYFFYNMDIGEDSLLYRITAIPDTNRKNQ